MNISYQSVNSVTSTYNTQSVIMLLLELYGEQTKNVHVLNYKKYEKITLFYFIYWGWVHETPQQDDEIT